MLSYRHSFHAGNYADVLKHLVQLAVLNHLAKKPKPFCVVDTHAGAGGYQLTSEHAQKTQEFVGGVGAIWHDKSLSEFDLVEQYLALVRQFNHSDSLEAYPGSPWFSMQALRDGDKLFLHEIHPTDFELLREFVGRNRQVKLFKEDGFQNTLALLPPPQKRGLVLIDPPYEVKDDYKKVVKLLQNAYKKFATGTYALWYPVVDRQRINMLKDDLIATGIKRIQCFELGLSGDTEEHGMTASGMIVINPPWTLMMDMQAILPVLTNVIAPEQGFYAAEEWVGE